MKKIIISLILIMMCSVVVASDYHLCDMSQLEIFSEWYDYCFYTDDIGETYLCKVSALDVMADYYYICWLN